MVLLEAELRQHSFPVLLFLHTSLQIEILSIYKSLLCQLLDIFLRNLFGSLTETVIPLDAAPGICSASGYLSENVMLFQNPVPSRIFKKYPLTSAWVSRSTVVSTRPFQFAQPCSTSSCFFFLFISVHDCCKRRRGEVVCKTLINVCQ